MSLAIAPHTISDSTSAPHARGYDVTHSSARQGMQKERIKILFIIDHIHGFGGTERHLYHLVNRLDRNKFACHLLVLDGVP